MSQIFNFLCPFAQRQKHLDTLNLIIFEILLLYQGPFLLTWANVNAWISNYIPHKVWDKITYPFPNCNALEMDA